MLFILDLKMNKIGIALSNLFSSGFCSTKCRRYIELKNKRTNIFSSKKYNWIFNQSLSFIIGIRPHQRLFHIPFGFVFCLIISLPVKVVLFVAIQLIIQIENVRRVSKSPSTRENCNATIFT